MNKKIMLPLAVLLTFGCGKRNDGAVAVSPQKAVPTIAAPAKTHGTAVSSTAAQCPFADVAGTYKLNAVACTLNGKRHWASMALIPTAYEITQQADGTGEMTLSFGRHHFLKRLKFPRIPLTSDFATNGTQCENQISNGKSTKSLTQACSPTEKKCSYTFSKIENVYSAAFSRLENNNILVCHSQLTKVR